MATVNNIYANTTNEMSGFDWGSLLSGVSVGVGIFNAGMGLLSGIFSARADRENARATASALREEKNYNIGVLNQQAVDQMWSDTMSLWRRGLSTGAGTSADAVIKNNQKVLRDNINFQSRMYDVKIANADAAAERRFLGIF